MIDDKVLVCLTRDHRQRRFGSKWWGGVLLCITLLFVTACGAETAAPPTTAQEVLPLPTVAPTATSTPVPALIPTATAVTAPSLLPTVAVTVAVESPLTVTVAAADLITNEIVREAAGLTVESEAADIAVDAVLPTEPCTVEPDIALAAYPDLQQHLGCAETAAGFDAVALNEFGPGPEYDRFMLWFSSENQIYVLLPNKTWQRYLDTWTEEQETFLCNPLDGEPTSPPLPRRGFGKIWCTVENLQETMGTIEREERLCQHTVTQFFERGRLLACYEDATIRFFRIMDDGTWDQMLTR